MKRVKEIKTYTYQAEEEWFVDIVDDGDTLWAYLHQGIPSHRLCMWGSPKKQPVTEDTTVRSLLKMVSNVWPEYIEQYENEVDAINAMYDEMEDEMFGDDECICCPVCGSKDVEMA